MRLFAAAAATVLALAASLTASAQETHFLEPVTDTVTGTTSPADAPRILPVRLFKGAPFSADIKAAKGSVFHPHVVLYGRDGKVDAGAVFVVASKGAKASLKNYIPKESGLHWIAITAADAGAGAWDLKTKTKFPKGIAGTGALAAGGPPVEFRFESPGQAIATITVTGSPKESGVPKFGGLKTPEGVLVNSEPAVPGKAGFSVKGAQLSAGTTYSLFVLPGSGAGTFSVKIAWKLLAPPRRDLVATAVIADPVVTSMDPAAGDTIDVLEAHLGVSFARPGAFVEFRHGTKVITVPAGGITLVPGEAQFSLSLDDFTEAVYDVALVNPDGGSGVLPDALSVSAVSPTLSSVSPAFAYENRVVRLRITGVHIQGTATAEMKRAGTTLSGSVVGFGDGFVDADFNLNGVARGAWDVLVTNPDAPPTSLVGAFEVLEIITLTSMTPPDNKDGLVVNAVFTGSGFVTGAAAKLTRTVDGNTEEIKGTAVTTVSGTEIHAVFDTTDEAPALWSVVLSFPTGESRTLTSVFRTRAIGGGGPPAQPFSVSHAADGPPALATNDVTGESMLAWVEEDPTGIVLHWDLYAQLLDSDGNPVGKAVKVSDDGGTMEKRYPTAGYDAVHDEYFVVWTEKGAVTPTAVKGQQHPNGTSSIQLFHVLAQRLASTDLTKTKTNIVVTDKTLYSRASKGTWYLSDFNAYRPALVFDPSGNQWVIAWMTEFDTTGLYFSDDYDVLQRTFNPKSHTLGTATFPAVTDAHEGDPALAWDTKAGAPLLAFNARASSKGGDLDLYLGRTGTYSLLVAGSGDELGDPRVAVDANSAMAVVTWTRAPNDGTRWIQAAAVSLGDLTTIVGSEQTLAKGGMDLFARPCWNPDQGGVRLFWTRNSGKGQFQVMRRDTDVSSGSDLVLVGDETEVSTGSGDEGLAAAVHSVLTGETVVAWLGTLQETGNKTYLGDVLPNGTIRGTDFWLQRLK